MRTPFAAIFFALLVACPLLAHVPAGPDVPAESSHSTADLASPLLMADPAAEADADDDDPCSSPAVSRSRAASPTLAFSLYPELPAPPCHLERLYLRFRQLLI